MQTVKLSPAAWTVELGERLKRARLNANLTQEAVAARAWISRKTVMQAEKGEVRLKDLVAILIALELAENLNLFLPKQELSPLQLLKLQGMQRQRASRTREKDSEEDLGW